MKKSFPLHAPGKDDARVRDKIRHEVNKYVKRCRARPVPEGFGVWEFICSVGPTVEQAESRLLDAVASSIDEVAATGAEKVYLEIEAVPAQRRR